MGPYSTLPVKGGCWQQVAGLGVLTPVLLKYILIGDKTLRMLCRSLTTNLEASLLS